MQCVYDFWINSLHKMFMEIVNLKMDIDKKRGPVFFFPVFIPESYLVKFFIRKTESRFHKPLFAVQATSLQGWYKLIWCKGICKINTKCLLSKVWMCYMSVFLRQPLYFHTTNEWVLNCHSEAVWGYFSAECLAKASWNSACVLQLINGGYWC